MDTEEKIISILEELQQDIDGLKEGQQELKQAMKSLENSLKEQREILEK